MSFECSCSQCTKACLTKPGLFMPGEAEGLAEKMGLSFEELFKTRLVVERIPCQPWDILVLAPAQDQSGACVFFEGGCSIHVQGKPYDCAMATHEGGASIAEIVNAWAPYQADLQRIAA